ncbi:hypothetical protein SLA2020_314940 [Shorea laevis]
MSTSTYLHSFHLFHHLIISSKRKAQRSLLAPTYNYNKAMKLLHLYFISSTSYPSLLVLTSLGWRVIALLHIIIFRLDGAICYKFNSLQLIAVLPSLFKSFIFARQLLNVKSQEKMKNYKYLLDEHVHGD